VKVGPAALLVPIVLGGIYGGILTPVESGAAGTVAAMIMGVLKRRLTAPAVWSALVETGHITANIQFLICVPLFLPALEPFNINLVWFGIITVIGAEIGLLTPPFGISCFVIKATIDDQSITLRDIFMGALPFAAVMLAVLWILIAFPKISLALV
jgi:TRAP-type mannitol/chloroaromatic compound transport system permease large subunit